MMVRSFKLRALNGIFGVSEQTRTIVDILLLILQRQQTVQFVN